MAGRLRWFAAAGFALLFWLLPAPDTGRDRAQTSFLRLRELLLAPDGPLRAWVVDGCLPPLVAEVRLSPPDEPWRERVAAALAHAAHEWAAARTAASARSTPSGAVAVDASLPAVPVFLHVGDAGARGAIVMPRGDPLQRDWRHVERSALLPPVLAIVLAVLYGRIALALLAGSLAGAVAWAGAALGGAEWPDGHAWAIDAGAHARVGAAALLLCAAFGVMTRARQRDADALPPAPRRARPTRAQLVALAASLLSAFDRRAGCLVGGAAAGRLADENGVSRAKAAYVVDTAAAAFAALSGISTWAHAEVARCRSALLAAAPAGGAHGVAGDAAAAVADAAPFRFYPMFALLLALLTIALRREIGPMLAAERVARLPDVPEAPPIALPAAAPARRPAIAIALGAALVPAAAVIAFVWLGPSSGDAALLLASSLALATTLGVAVGSRALSLPEAVRTALRAPLSLGPTLATLVLAWSFAATCRALGTDLFLAAAFGDLLVGAAQPVAAFLLAGLVAFATGSPWAAVAILLPAVLAQGAAGPQEAAATLLAIAAVLDGALFGSHCSPASETTVLGSLGTRCEHFAHVRTQLPYAALAMAVAALFGYLPAAWLGPSWWPASLLLGTAALIACMRWLGRDPRAAAATSTA